jgi:hypothetical protein
MCHGSRILTTQSSSLFAEHGVFPSTVQVSEEVAKAPFIKIVFRWTDVWDKYEAHSG